MAASIWKKKPSFTEIALFAEACLFLFLAAFLKKFVPFRCYAGLLGKHGASMDADRGAADPERVTPLVRAIDRAARHLPIENRCLDQALCGFFMLRRRRLPSDLYLGVDRNESREIVAHAWLKSGDCFVTGRIGHRNYTIISVFARRPSARN